MYRHRTRRWHLLPELPVDDPQQQAAFEHLRYGGRNLLGVVQPADHGVTREPLKIEAITPQPEGLQAYETDFIKAFGTDVLIGQRQALQNLTLMCGLDETLGLKGRSL